MKIHLNLPEHKAIDALNDARRAADVVFERVTLHGSRTHERAVDVILSGDSPHAINSGRSGSWGDAPRAASWDQWGIFLAVIFEADPTAKAGRYANAEDFHHKTAWRFDADGEPGAITSTSSPGYQRAAHNWKPVAARRLVCVNGRHGDCAAVYNP